MPELPEVEHVVRALRRTVVGRTIVASEINLPKLIAPTTLSLFKRKLKNVTVCGVSRRGKFILIECQRPGHSEGLVLMVHLRMTGKFLYLKADDDLPKHSHAVFYLDNDRRLVFRDQRQFGIMRVVSQTKLNQAKGIAELAPEPFSEEFSVDYLREVFSRSTRTLKTFLLDQTKVLGLGNIYAVEALFRAGINPFRPANTLSAKRVVRLHTAIQEVLDFAIGHIRAGFNLEEGFSYGEAFERFWQVYEREGEPCVKCGSRIRRVAHGGRSTYWCPRCQRR
jgi:formamidopyrimidine-DNA glycosylase (fpg)